mmetsp:Transcript_10410/g.13196  ORF Transcript_10410/g.13196 Transcript_10410/m.13196 type:complete len:1066 (+) Transcript_10410:82-3279(+)
MSSSSFVSTPLRKKNMESSKKNMKLTSDMSHTPKTHGSLGILVIGIGGANGTTMLSGILANRQKVKWYGPRGEGPIDANYNGCITQLHSRGVHGGVGYKDKIPGLADANMAAVGGWDVRPTKLGDALLQGQILDFDLVKQVKDEMNNKYSVFKGYYDPRFIGSSQHEHATHILSQKEAPNAADALKCIRADIRYFKWKNGVVGHTTVIWSASVEPNCELCVAGGGLDSAINLLKSIEMSEEERGGPLPPSLIYATAAILEGCSFVNGGSQNTMCGGLAELAKQQLGIYCLGTDFKAGQTKFKTAAVEYLRTMGLTPKVIASSNHLGNNDMRNLATADSARMAKLRVKHDIFAPWEEDIDHKVSVMYCPMINDEKRDFVEYTSLGFLSQHHTMVTYTKASDSVLCVPLMIDAAVWCDYFSRKSWQYENVAKALAYLFKVPEGAAKGVDPGFFRQMQQLEQQVMAASGATATTTIASRKNDIISGKRSAVRFKESQSIDNFLTEYMIPNNAGIICAGLACVDMQLLSATGGDGGESIETFAGEKSIGGGSVSMACKTLARLCHVDPLEDEYMQITPPVVSTVVPLCKVGFDSSGDKLINLLESTGSSCRNVETRFIKNARKRDPKARTGLAVLPIYQDGRRGCFFDAASNDTFAASDMVEMFDDVKESLSTSTSTYGALVFGYPHLLPMMQGEALAHIFSKSRSLMEDGGIIVLDLNGVPNGDNATPWGSMCSTSVLQSDNVIGPALSHVDILHLNEEELVNITGIQLEGSASAENDATQIKNAISLFLKCGVAVVAVTRGKKGCYIGCNDEERFARTPMLPMTWAGEEITVEATELPSETEINSNGAGDAFTSGLLLAAMLRHTGVCMQYGSPAKEYGDNFDYNLNSSIESFDIEGSTTTKEKNKKKVTPYSLYMRENYVALKAQCSDDDDDKKAIFTRCNEMWEEESEEIKKMYERRANEESMMNSNDSNEPSMSTSTSSIPSASGPPGPPPESPTLGEAKMMMSPKISRNLKLTNQPMNIETAAQFASLVAARHVDTSTRECTYLNINTIREESSVSAHGLEEI